MEKETIRKLARDLMFDLTDDEIVDIQNDFELLQDMLSFFDTIDTINVEEMIYPYDIEMDYLRKDRPENLISNEEALSNTTKSAHGCVVVPKVVK